MNGMAVSAMRHTLIGLLIAASFLVGCDAHTAPQVTSQPPSAATASSSAALPQPTPARTASGLGKNKLLYGRFLDDTRKGAFIANADGTGEHRILEQVDGDIRGAAWLNWGNLIVFVVRDAAHPDGAIWTSYRDGTGAILIYDGTSAGCNGVFHPAVGGPDGNRLALVCYRPEGSALGVLDLQTRKLRLLATYAWPEFLDNPASWSNDGTTLAYDVLHWDPTDSFVDGSRIATIPADGSAGPTYLNGFDSFAARPSWIYDQGGYLIFNTYDLSSVHGDEASDLFIVRADGSNVNAFLTASQAGVARLAQPLWDGVEVPRVWVTALTGAGLRIGWIDYETRKLTLLPIEGSEVDFRG